MTFVDAVRICFAKYITFSGRGPRKEYWYFVLFLIIGSVVAGGLDSLLFGGVTITVQPGDVAAESDGPIASAFGLVTIVPSISAGWRRMHDTGRSGLYLLYPIIVVVGILTFTGLLAGFDPLLQGDFGALVAGGSSIVIGIALFVLFLSPLLVLWWLTRPSEPGANDYGPNPHEVSP
ncbi:DUF805 domain-containing protein [Palleronia rufa]|uniref:DUF805 domain-containing protein n=1 Tax=Palleronia rufa TaxID=1530186 RepID=UPI000565B0AF|nr:DUF805 domain-containing protein [Palleronia rufa]